MRGHRTQNLAYRQAGTEHRAQTADKKNLGSEVEHGGNIHKVVLHKICDIDHSIWNFLIICIIVPKCKEARCGR